jgi:hypothetical protein
VRQIGHDFAQKCVLDEESIPLLRKLRRPTFVTLDWDFLDGGLRHRSYCIICLSVLQSETAMFCRRFLQHPQFKTQSLRMGYVAKGSHVGISGWRLPAG